MKSEKGSITLMVSISFICILIVALGVYMNVKNKQLEQEKESERIVESYQKDVEEIEKIYQNQVNEIQNNGGNISEN